MTLIEELMRQIVNLPDVHVYSVTVQFQDHSTKWTAWAHLRADTRSYSAEADSPERALGELKQVLLSTVCPYCRQALPEPKDD